jgi:hypothetical protein
VLIFRFLQRGLNVCDQVLFVERLFKEGNGPCVQGSLAEIFFGDCRDKDEGVRSPRAINALCRSMPLKPGICRSVITQSVSLRRPDSRNAWAEGNAAAAKPNDLIKLIMAARHESSSSTIEITGTLKLAALDVDEGIRYKQEKITQAKVRVDYRKA